MRVIGLIWQALLAWTVADRFMRALRDSQFLDRFTWESDLPPRWGLVRVKGFGTWLKLGRAAVLLYWPNVRGPFIRRIG